MMKKIAKAAEKLTLAWTSSDESVATVDETGTVTAIAAGEAEITATVKDTEMQDVCVITVIVSAKELKVPDTLEVKLNDTDEKPQSKRNASRKMRPTFRLISLQAMRKSPPSIRTAR